jgi:hypothetical protein
MQPQAQATNLGIQTFVNSTPMSPVHIDTTEGATDTIQYVATDQSGVTSTTTRTVIVEAPDTSASGTSTPQPATQSAADATSTAATTTAQ